MNKYLISPIAGAAAFLLFFAPWVSCGDMMKWNGMELASGSLGNSMMGGAGATESSGDPLLYAVPVAGLLIVGLYFMFKKSNRLASALMPTIIVALLGLFVMSMTYIKIQDRKAKMAEEMGNINTGAQDRTSDTADAPPSSGGDFGSMMGGMGLQIEWGFWLTAVAFVVAAAGATKYRDLPKTGASVVEASPAPPGETVPSNLPPDTSITEDKGMG